MFIELLTVLLVCIESVLGGLWWCLPTLTDISEVDVPHVSVSAVVTRVIDGDTIDVIVGTSTKTTRVRYIGIDTPELYPKYATEPECGSKEAAVANAQLVTDKIVVLVTDADPFDTYGRLLAYVYVGDIFVNQELLTQGFATTLFVKPNTSYRKEFTVLRTVAKTAQIGNWKNCPAWNESVLVL